MTEDELDGIRRRRDEAVDIAVRMVDEIPIDELLLAQIRAPWGGNVQVATMLSCARLHHPTIHLDDPPTARCVCNWRKGT
jgi:hypothetical protein